MGDGRSHRPGHSVGGREGHTRRAQPRQPEEQEDEEDEARGRIDGDGHWGEEGRQRGNGNLSVGRVSKSRSQQNKTAEAA